MRILLQHQTRYQYERPVYLTTHYLRLKPAPHCRTPIESYKLAIEPQSHILHWQQDPFANFLARVDFTGPIQALVVDVNIVVDYLSFNPLDFYVDEKASCFPFLYDDQLQFALSPYLETTEQHPAIREWLRKIDRSPQDIVTFLAMLNSRVSQEVIYNTRMEPGVQTSSETLELGSGSCRDSAWLLVQCLRQLGLATRFVSGYLIQLADKTENKGKPSADTAALHAWAEVYIPGAGWIGMDTTSGLFAAEGHIPLACTPSAELAAPVAGTSELCKTDFTYKTQIYRL